MAKKTYSATIEEPISTAFKEKCKKENVNQSMLIEAFMRSYVNDRIKLELVNNKMETPIKEC